MTTYINLIAGIRRQVVDNSQIQLSRIMATERARLIVFASRRQTYRLLGGDVRGHDRLPGVDRLVRQQNAQDDRRHGPTDAEYSRQIARTGARETPLTLP